MSEVDAKFFWLNEVAYAAGAVKQYQRNPYYWLWNLTYIFLATVTADTAARFYSQGRGVQAFFMGAVSLLWAFGLWLNIVNDRFRAERLRHWKAQERMAREQLAFMEER